MLEGLVAAGFYHCLYGRGRHATLVGAGVAVFLFCAYCMPVPEQAALVVSALWIMLAGCLSRAEDRGRALLAGGIWFTARQAAGLWPESAGLQTAPLQRAMATAFFLAMALWFLGQARPRPMWLTVLSLSWLMTGFLGSIAYAETWQGQVMTASLYLTAGGILVCQQVSLIRQTGSGTMDAGAGEGQSAGGEAAWREAAHRELRRLQIFEHDFRHHLDMVGVQYENGNVAGARVYIADLKQARISLQGREEGGERELSYIMMAKKESCRQAGISYSYQIVGSPQGISQMDMTALLLNLLDNAIRACAKAPQPRSIAVMLLSRGELWQIEMVNSGQFEVGAGGEERREGPVHGIGLISVRQIVEKYQGTYQIRQKEGQVIQTLILAQGRQSS